MNDKEFAKVLIEFLFSNDVSHGCSSVELMFWIIATVLVNSTLFPALITASSLHLVWCVYKNNYYCYCCKAHTFYLPPSVLKSYAGLPTCSKQPRKQPWKNKPHPPNIVCTYAYRKTTPHDGGDSALCTVQSQRTHDHAAWCAVVIV